MTHLTQAISPLRQRMIEDMRMRKFSPKTQNAYIRAVRRFAAFLGGSPAIGRSRSRLCKNSGKRWTQIFFPTETPVFPRCSFTRT
jgi:hypothetical protein